jgi:hypothetical protein
VRRLRCLGGVTSATEFTTGAGCAGAGSVVGGSVAAIWGGGEVVVGEAIGVVVSPSATDSMCAARSDVSLQGDQRPDALPVGASGVRS